MMEWNGHSFFYTPLIHFKTNLDIFPGRWDAVEPLSLNGNLFTLWWYDSNLTLKQIANSPYMKIIWHYASIAILPNWVITISIPSFPSDFPFHFTGWPSQSERIVFIVSTWWVTTSICNCFYGIKLKLFS